MTVLSLLFLVVTGCPTGGSSDGAGSAYQVVYEGNGATGGSPPVDDTLYETGTEVTVLGNTGELVRPGHGFAGWNSTADGAGDAYAAGDTFTMGASDVTLYAAWAQELLPTDGTVASYQKISDTEGGFAGALADMDRFGRSVANIGDLDGDGVADLAVGAMGDHDGGTDRGAVWILFLNGDGTVKSHQKISDTEGGFTGVLYDEYYFGYSVTAIGDLDGDGVVDLALGGNEPELWVIFLNSNGTVKSHQKISSTEGGFTGTLGVVSGVASLGDFDGDGVADLAVGAMSDNDGGDARGAVWVLFINSDGTVKSDQKISDTVGGFTGVLENADFFGSSVAPLGDLDGDGVMDLAVGAINDNDGGTNRGAVWILFLNSDGTVKSHQKISDTEGGFTGTLEDWNFFGASVVVPGDLDGDGVADLAVGAMGDHDGVTARGAVWILFLNGDGTVKGHQKISDTEGGFDGILDDGDSFGGGVTSLEDLDGDGVMDLAVGATLDDDGGTDRGAVWVLFLNEAE